ncbi:MAG: sigma-70 family RNA polymerase sigma factor [Bacteroidales bacterium]|jgi:RNA polymerase sigma-70 factor (ECF subfamily)|nr:sigma-70 family RNA polymerase sigma factor [Bacteroidales bacterium]MDD2263332.1 sigma-70 family RNA polymerase sigma factor [Bacteroidales bacterium]MDD2830878.1 sigma-70 family RNA polymerase sigma factor [Bacteroidales bacterium]MDD3208077.1 sigma-70 family RNA polymerase sigma factor [Bacteroidales bacterium]MDD3696416.1 sigma-70 family RNA polymerase sigma factor [Bacteroidales bacterium]
MTDERQIIRAIIDGHTAQYRILVERYQNPVFRVIYKIVNNHEEARELTQDVFVKTYESLNQYDPQYRFFSWIYRMAINRALLSVRNRKSCVEPGQITLREKMAQEDRPFILRNLRNTGNSGKNDKVTIVRCQDDVKGKIGKKPETC